MGQRIADALNRLGVSITDLGLEWGGNRQTVQFWERGANFPPAGELPRLCHMLLIDANELLGVDPIGRIAERDILAARQSIVALAARAKQNSQDEDEVSALIAPKKRARR